MKTRYSQSLKILCALSLLCAISIIAGKYLAIRGGEVLRFSFENLPIILSGMLFGPLAGLCVGAVSDLVGCVLVGYTINPVITVASALIGTLAGLVYPLMKRVGVPLAFSVTFTVFFVHGVGSVIIKTFGLLMFYDMEWWVLMLWRALNYLIVGALEAVLLSVLMKNKMFSEAVKPLLKKKDGNEK